jgi:hypothetical protein
MTWKQVCVQLLDQYLSYDPAVPVALVVSDNDIF